MQFQFRLMPVEAIDPWGTEEGHPNLSWFGLTDGWFWIEIGGQELFRYSQVALDYWSQLHPQLPTELLPFEHYQIARYWEDLLEMLPTILDPIPSDFATRVANVNFWQNWRNYAYRWAQEREEDEVAWDTYSTAVTWCQERIWSATHLAHPPHLYLWRQEETIHIRWDNRDVMVGNGIPVWTAEQGEVTLSVSEFVLAVQSFNEQFLLEMGHSVDSAITGWTRSYVEINLVALKREQQERSGRLESALDPWVAQVRRPFSWEANRAAIITIEQSLAE